MNSLSWLIYGAEVLPSIGNVAAAVGVISGIGLVVVNIATGIARAHHNDMSSCYRGDPVKGVRVEHGFVLSRLAAVPLIALSLAAFVPSKNTIYLIAASEMGQKLYETPGTQEVLSDLQAIIKAELAKMKEKAK